MENTDFTPPSVLNTTEQVQPTITDVVQTTTQEMAQQENLPTDTTVQPTITDIAQNAVQELAEQERANKRVQIAATEAIREVVKSFTKIIMHDYENALTVTDKTARVQPEVYFEKTPPNNLDTEVEMSEYQFRILSGQTIPEKDVMFIKVVIDNSKNPIDSFLSAEMVVDAIRNCHSSFEREHKGSMVTAVNLFRMPSENLQRRLFYDNLNRSFMTAVDMMYSNILSFLKNNRFYKDYFSQGDYKPSSQYRVNDMD